MWLASYKFVLSLYLIKNDSQYLSCFRHSFLNNSSFAGCNNEIINSKSLII